MDLKLLVQADGEDSEQGAWLEMRSLVKVGASHVLVTRQGFLSVVKLLGVHHRPAP